MKLNQTQINLLQGVFGWRTSPEIKTPPSKYGIVLTEEDENWTFAQYLVENGLAVMFRRDNGCWNIRATFIENDGGEKEFWKHSK